MASVGGTLVPVTAEAAGDALQTTAFSDGSDARLTIFPSASGPRLAWRLVVDQDSQHLWHTVVDATSGDVLYRENLVKFATGPAWSYFPGPLPFNGGGHARRAATSRPWLGSADDPGRPQRAHLHGRERRQHARRRPTRSRPRGRQLELRAHDGSTRFFGNCDSNFPCSWDCGAATRGQTNAYQNATQVFYFVNNFHDHLELDAEHRVQQRRPATSRRGDDAVQAQAHRRRQHRQRLPRRPTTSTTRTCRRARTASRRGCRCTCSPADGYRRATRTAATTPRSSTTSTPTGCRPGSSPTPPASRRSAAARRTRWARPGATGTRWTT